jgi:hypothetical protein
MPGLGVQFKPGHSGNNPEIDPNAVLLANSAM